ncbi:MAG TPA: hypothetical protein VJ654_20355 [Noviherbaspirillum sp.]|nr:hypothetical protein [Noviherbaspirillum sp.]
MSLAVAAVTTIAVGAYVSYENGKRQADAQEAAMKQAQANADRQAKLAEQDMNRANQKRPDTLALLDAASQAGKAGVAGTMLTGPQGIDMSALQLGKNTLLGQ